MIPNTNFLTEILARKRARLKNVQAACPIGLMRARAAEVRRHSERQPLRRALERCEGINVIAEIKRASPSRGVIKDGFAPAELACAYALGGAIAISVLTEEDYFRGSLDDLCAVREAVPIPILRKDFIVDEYQIYETAAAGADALLLITAALDDEQLSRFRHIAEDELGMDALVEVHTVNEMRRAQCCGATLIGVNNRNLRTFEVSLNASVELAHKATEDAVLVSESGLCSGGDLRRLRELGYRGFLIGEALLRAEDPSEALQKLIRDAGKSESVLVKICGITNLKDAEMCVRLGADMLGFNFYAGSPRYIAPAAARRIVDELPPEVLSVGIFVNEDSPEKAGVIADAAGVAALQLHGEETELYCRALQGRRVIKALRAGPDFTPERAGRYQTHAILLDAFSSKARGGSGERFDWSLAQQTRQFVSKLFLAGGLTPENVAEAVAVVRPYAVDVCSSLESAPGQKDEKRVREFMAAVKVSRAEARAVSE